MKKVLAIASLIILFVPLFAYAATPCTLEAAKLANDPSKSLPQCINQIYVWSLGVASLLALLMMVGGGYYYMTAAGNAEKSSKGTDMIWSSVIGIALLFGAYLLLRTINPQLVELQFKSLNGLNNNQSQTQTQQPRQP